MKKQYGLLFLGLSSIHAPLLAQRTDTLPIAHVEAPRFKLFSAGVNISTFDSTIISQNSTSNVAELLAMYTPVNIKSYGPGSLATVSFRGTNSAQTQIDWNGFPINSITSGELDLSQVPVFLTDDITLTHGGAGAVGGNGAIGGSIHLNNTPLWKTGTEVKANMTLGSFSEQRGNIKFSAGTSRIQSSTGLYLSGARNDFPFVNHAEFGSPVTIQSNAANQQRGLTQMLYGKINNNNIIWGGLWYQYNYKQIPPTMLTLENHTWQNDSAFRSFIGYEHLYNKGNIVVKTAYFNEFLRYNDPVALINSKFEVRKYLTETELHHFFNSKILLDIALNYGYYSAFNNKNYISTATESQGDLFAGLRYSPVSTWQISVSARQQKVKGYQPPLAPSLGIEGRILKQGVYLKGNLSSSYRVASFNDRYWMPGGNPNIQPEKGYGGEAGIKYLLNEVGRSTHHVEMELTHYRALINNWIEWQPGPLGIWSPQNLKQVYTRGIELKSRYDLSYKQMQLSVYGNYAYTLATNNQVQKNTDSAMLGKQLFYTPLHNYNLGVHLLFRGWFTSAATSYTGWRYTTADNTSFLPSYIITNVAVGKKKAFKNFSSTIQFKINNLFNEDYQAIQWWAMPGRSYSLNLTLQIGTHIN